MSDWFSEKEITVYSISEGSIDDYGIYHKTGLTELETLYCDIQPSSREQIYREYGFDIDCIKRLFCDFNNNISVGNIVLYSSEYFKIVKVIEWDDYLDVFMNSVKVGTYNV